MGISESFEWAGERIVNNEKSEEVVGVIGFIYKKVGEWRIGGGSEVGQLKIIVVAKGWLN